MKQKGEIAHFEQFHIFPQCFSRVFFCKWRKVVQKDRKHFGKRRNCSLRAIRPFLEVFSKDFY